MSWILQTHELYKDFYKDVDKDVNKKVKKKNPEPTRRGLWIKSAHKIDQVDIPTATGKDQEIQDTKSSPPDLSLEQFPVLQVTTRSNPPAISESAELSAKTMQLKQSTTAFGTIKFPTFKHTPSSLGLPSQLPSEQADPATSYPTDSTLYSAAPGVHKKEELLVTVEKRYVHSSIQNVRIN